MTPSALLGGTAPLQNGSTGASSARPEMSSGSDRREFDAMLSPGADTPRPAASSKPAGRRDAPAGKDAATPDTGKDTAPRPGSASSKDAAETPATTDAGAAPPPPPTSRWPRRRTTMQRGRRSAWPAWR
ncbi:hypothetical protein QT383_07070 [Stenotrophomonas rhizophila]